MVKNKQAFGFRNVSTTKNKNKIMLLYTMNETLMYFVFSFFSVFFLSLPELAFYHRLKAEHLSKSNCWSFQMIENDIRDRQSSGAVWKSKWPSWAPVPNKPTVSVDVKQHFNNNIRDCLNVLLFLFSFFFWTGKKWTQRSTDISVVVKVLLLMKIFVVKTK